MPRPKCEESQQWLIKRLYEKNVISATQRSLFHDLRRIGNAAVHENAGDQREALHQLRMARSSARRAGSRGLNKVFDGSLEALLGDLADEVWRDAHMTHPVASIFPLEFSRSR